MDTKNLDDLKANPKNPRTIDKHDYAALVVSIKKFGDLSGIVLNVRTGQLVGGHQRTEAFKRMGGSKKIIITQRYQNADGTPQPNAKGTVALGYVDFENEHYGYREVDWDANFEFAANIAANRIQGKFDLDLLAQVNYEISQLENGADLLAATGQTEDEINKLLAMVSGDGELDDKYNKEIVAPTYEPSGEKPDTKDLVDHDKTSKLLAEIEVAEIDDKDKLFLKIAAQRHDVFNYELIANYYANSSPQVQDLMEKSALVIIDYDKAIENGFTKLTNEITETQKEDYAE